MKGESVQKEMLLPERVHRRWLIEEAWLDTFGWSRPRVRSTPNGSFLIFYKNQTSMHRQPPGHFIEWVLQSGYMPVVKNLRK
jgi:hypothetical protein